MGHRCSSSGETAPTSGAPDSSGVRCFCLRRFFEGDLLPATPSSASAAAAVAAKTAPASSEWADTGAEADSTTTESDAGCRHESRPPGLRLRSRGLNLTFVFGSSLRHYTGLTVAARLGQLGHRQRAATRRSQWRELIGAGWSRAHHAHVSSHYHFIPSSLDYAFPFH